MMIIIMLIAQVRHTVRSSRIFDSDPVDIVPSTGMHKSCTASSIADLGDDHDDDDDDDNDHDEDFTQSKHRSEVFALMEKCFLANGAGRKKPSVSPPTFCKIALSHQLGEIQMQFFLGNLNFSGKQSLTAGTTSTIFALPSIFLKIFTLISLTTSKAILQLYCEPVDQIRITNHMLFAYCK